MKLKEIIEAVNKRCHNVQDTGYYDSPKWYAHYFMIEGMLKACEMAGESIEVEEEPDITCMAKCYEEPYTKGVLSVSVRVGGQEQPYKSHTPFFMQIRHEGSDKWHTLLTNVYADRFSDINYVTETPPDAKPGDMYEVRLKVAL